MKSYCHPILCSLLVLLGLTSLSVAASPLVVEVKVSNAAGKVFYKGKTDASGAFATAKLPVGDYLVQFNAEQPLKGGPFALAVNAGKTGTDADALPAGKFSKGGVALKIAVNPSTNLTGKIGPAGSLAKAPVAASTKGGLKTKVVDGREMVWIPPEQGGWLPGKWVAADSAEGRNAAAEQAAKARPTGR